MLNSKSHYHFSVWVFQPIFVLILTLTVEQNLINAGGIENRSATTENVELNVKSFSERYCDEDEPCTNYFELCDTYTSRCVENKTVTGCEWNERWDESLSNCVEMCNSTEQYKAGCKCQKDYNCGLDYGLILGIIALSIMVFAVVCYCCFRLEGCFFYHTCSKKEETEDNSVANFAYRPNGNGRYDDFVFSAAVGPYQGCHGDQFPYSHLSEQRPPPPPYFIAVSEPKEITSSNSGENSFPQNL